MKNYIKEFDGYLVAVKHSSENTVQSYNRDIINFCNYSAKSYIDDMAAVTSDFLHKYIEYLYDIGKSPSTVSRTISSIKCYYRFLQSLSLCETLPTDGLKPKPTNAKKMPVILDYNEVRQLLAQPDMNEYKGIRDKAMLEVLYATGIKVTELITLKTTDLNLSVGIIELNGENGLHRTVPLYDEAIHILSLYLRQVRSSVITESAQQMLFTNMNGTQLTRQGFWKIIKSYSKSAGIKKDITPNTLRHSFAVHLLENGAQISDIQELLGHADVSSTKFYTKVVKNKYAAKYQRFHPMARKEF